MALSNIFNEPRREITETLVGLVLAVLICVALYYGTSRAIEPLGLEFMGWPAHILVMCLGVLALAATFIGSVILWGLAIFIHFIGEEICNSLEERGIHLRPWDRGM